VSVTNQAAGSSHRLLGVNELAERWGVSVQTIYRRRSTGDDLPPAVKIGSQVRWRLEVVDAWERAHESAVR
jgi:prophage regulatory protein